MEFKKLGLLLLVASLSIPMIATDNNTQAVQPEQIESNKTDRKAKATDYDELIAKSLPYCCAAVLAGFAVFHRKNIVKGLASTPEIMEGIAYHMNKGTIFGLGFGLGTLTGVSMVLGGFYYLVKKYQRV